MDGCLAKFLLLLIPEWMDVHPRFSVVQQEAGGGSPTFSVFAVPGETWRQRLWVVGDALASSGDHPPPSCTVMTDLSHTTLLSSIRIKMGISCPTVSSPPPPTPSTGLHFCEQI